MEMIIDFPGGARVDAHFRGHDLPTDQPPQGGGEDAARQTPLFASMDQLGSFRIGDCYEQARRLFDKGRAKGPGKY